MTTEENKKMAIGFAQPANSRNLAECDRLVDEVYATNYILHEPGMPDSMMGSEGIKQFMHKMIENTPDLLIKILDVLAEGDKTAARFTVFGTNTSTGNPEVTEFMLISRFSGGKIVEEWQLGVQIPNL